MESNGILKREKLEAYLIHTFKVQVFSLNQIVGLPIIAWILVCLYGVFIVSLHIKKYIN